MKKRAFAALLLIVATALSFSGCGRFRWAPSRGSASAVSELSGVYLYGISEAPYGIGDIQFTAVGSTAAYRYRVFGADGTLPSMAEPFDASSWKSLENGAVLSGTDCRNIVIATTDDAGMTTAAKVFEYVPGVLYGNPNPDQYDDPVFYNADAYSTEDSRAVRLAASLFRSSRTSYYGSFGSVIQGYLTSYSEDAGAFSGLYHTGTDFAVLDGQPFFSPIDATVIYAGATDNYHMIILYNSEHDISLLLLHGADVSPAAALLEAGGAVKAGDLLGYGGGAGNPPGQNHIHVEVKTGFATRYQNFSAAPYYTRLTNYDPLILADMFSLTTDQTPSLLARPYSVVGASSYNAQNSAAVAAFGNWVYFINYADSSRLYRSRPNGTEISKLSDYSVANLNYVDGWLYFSNMSSGGIGRCRYNGEDYSLVSERLADVYLLYADGFLYFIGSADSKLKRFALENPEDVAFLTSVETAPPFYADGRFYYAVNTSRKLERLWRVNANTTDPVALMKDLRADKPSLFGGSLLYRKKYDSTFCRGTDPEAPNDATSTLLIANGFSEMNAIGNYLLYANENDGQSLYLTSFGSTAAWKLSGDALCSHLCVLNNMIYYTTPGQNGFTVYKVNPVTYKRYQLTAEGFKEMELVHDDALNVSAIIDQSVTDNLIGAEETPLPVQTQPPVPTATPVPATPAPTAAQTPSVIATPIPLPTAAPVEEPTEVPAEEPTEAPAAPTDEPTEQPTEVPAEPTEAPNPT